MIFNKKLKRNILIDFEEQWLKQHPSVKENPAEYVSFLNELENIISKYDYEYDDRFFTYCRRDFLRKEFSDYLNDIAYAGRGKFNDAFVDLAEYYSGNTWITPSSVPTDKDSHKIIDKDAEYRNSNIICKQEIEIIKDMIQEFKNHLS